MSPRSAPARRMLPFWKMSGAGNDFALIEGRPPKSSWPALTRRLCDRREGVGADGLLVMTRAGGPRLDYFNADGSEAFCGNGTRCAALWASARGWARGPRFTLHTSRGSLRARLTGKERAEIEMPGPKGLVLGLRPAALKRRWTVNFVDTGVPHAVVFVKNIEKAPVGELGPALRSHKIFGKAGTNVDFISIKNGIIHLRTYERGVEAETMACGTGVVAAAFVARALGRAGEPARICVRGGEVLRVSFAGGARLEGPGRIVYEGVFPL